MVKNNDLVCAIIATYNRKELLLEGIKALLNQKYKNLKIIVVDNASTDGTEEYLKKVIDNKRVFLKHLKKNLGSSGGFNEAIRVASKMNPKYIWFLDDDTIVHNDSLSKLLDVANELNDDFGFLGSKVLWKDDSICKMNIPRKTPFRSNDNFDDKVVPIVTSSFVSMLLKMETVYKYGLPMEAFFIWTDDWEYSRRLSRNLPCYLVNDSVVTHKCPSNNGSNIVSDSPDRLWRYEYAFRNEGYYYKREGIKGYLYLLLRQFYYIPKILFSRSKTKFSKIKTVFKSTWRGFLFNPPVEYLKGGRNR